MKAKFEWIMFGFTVASTIDSIETGIKFDRPGYLVGAGISALLIIFWYKMAKRAEHANETL